MYLEDRMQSWEALHGRYSDDLSNQMSGQKVILEQEQLEI